MSDLADLATTFRHTVEVFRAEARKVVAKGSLNIKTEARQIISDLRHHHPTYLPHYPRSISYDVDDTAGGGIQGSIGPDAHLPQGPLGNILEYGSANSVPYPHLNPALDHEVPRFEQNLADLAERLFLDRPVAA
jgi:hypothetical protein